MVFVDREEELAWLEEGWASGRPQLRILYGRRRVGKSALLDAFAAGKRRIIFQAVEGTTADQLRDLTAAVLACEEDSVLRAAPLVNWAQALATFARMADRGPLLVILDEYQYAAEADPSLASQLQRWWSRDVSTLPLYVVLCGSYVRFFERNVLTGLVYGRHTGAWQLRPLGYRQTATFFPTWSREDHIRAYAVTGGIPHYTSYSSIRAARWPGTSPTTSCGVAPSSIKRPSFCCARNSKSPASTILSCAPLPTAPRGPARSPVVWGWPLTSPPTYAPWPLSTS